jgi:hypothetical protein
VLGVAGVAGAAAVWRVRRVSAVFLFCALTLFGALAAMACNQVIDSYPASEMPIWLFLIGLLAAVVLAQI